MFARVIFALVVFTTFGTSGCAFLTPKLSRNLSTIHINSAVFGDQRSSCVEQILKSRGLPTGKIGDEDLALIIKKINADPAPDLVYAYVETAYLEARRREARRPAFAEELYFSAALYAYHYLFNPYLIERRNRTIYAPSALDVKMLYNASCERLLRLALTRNGYVVSKKPRKNENQDDFPFKPSAVYRLVGETRSSSIYCHSLHDAWRPEEIDSFLLAEDCNEQELEYDYYRSGLGVPLVVKRRPSAEFTRREEAYYPTGLLFPATAVLRPNPSTPLGSIPALDAEGTLPPASFPADVDAELELYDPLASPVAQIDNQEIELEADLTTPLSHFLAVDKQLDYTTGKKGLFNPETLLEPIELVEPKDAAREKESPDKVRGADKKAPEEDDEECRGEEKAEETEYEDEEIRAGGASSQMLRGVYMLEPYDPRKIPIVMTHGLGSSPMTWMEMYNALRSVPIVMDSYQFWFYFYPTGLPFWVSAAQLRQDLNELRETVDPRHKEPALDQMVLIGHSMGGLVSRMQVMEPGDRIWRQISDASLDELNFEPEDRENLREWFFFEPNPSVRRVITVATPFKGSDFANGLTEWLADCMISVPKAVKSIWLSRYSAQAELINDSTLLETTTSVQSLSPESPIFSALEKCPIPDDVALNNIVGVAPNGLKKYFSSAKTDGVVAFASSHRTDVESELEVPSTHSYVHSHPSAIMEVKEILLRHLESASAPTETLGKEARLLENEPKRNAQNDVLRK
ncbi:MAG: hypothetical protein HUK22_05570 [Thermoguttaceae bacterium]|nr:hypothetical protein [Thermoguttaceae bacterium]